MEISDLIKSARIEKGLTQQQLADVVFVTRQTISKWELGKSVPDQASLILLYQYLDIKDNEKKQLSKLIFNKQNIILILIAILFSPMVLASGDNRHSGSGEKRQFWSTENSHLQFE